MNKLFLALLTVTLLAGCNPKRDVSGGLVGTDETFTGELKRFRDTTGELVLHSNYNVDCTGKFIHGNPKSAKGTLSCTDGRTGTFEFTNGVDGGDGDGRLDNRKFTFKF